MKGKFTLITTAAVIIGVMMSACLIPLALAEDPSPYRGVYTYIKRVLNDAGKLIAQEGKTTTSGFTDLDGNRYKYSITEVIEFEVIGGEAIRVRQTTTEERIFVDKDGNPIKSDEEILTQTITTTLEYTFDGQTGILQGISGTRIINGYGDPIDANKNGKIDEDELANRNYMERTETLEFSPIEGTSEFKITTVTANTFEYNNDKKETKISETLGAVTLNTYDKQGRLIQSETTGITHYFNIGTTDGKEQAPDKSNLPFTNFREIDYYAYDEAGNTLPTSGVTVSDLDGKLTEADVQTLINKAGGSFSVRYSDGRGKGAADQWVDFTTTELTIYEVKNGALRWVARGTGYSEHDLR